MPASVGFIALFGIALENGLVLVSYLNELVRDGVSIAEASVRAACARLRAVIMTAVTTALGLFRCCSPPAPAARCSGHWPPLWSAAWSPPPY